MPPRCSTCRSPSGNRIPAYSLGRWTTLARLILIVVDVRHLLVMRTPRQARRRLTSGDAISPNRSNDGSCARSPRTGGGGRRPDVADRSDEDGPDDDFNPETFLDSLVASD